MRIRDAEREIMRFYSDLAALMQRRDEIRHKINQEIMKLKTQKEKYELSCKMKPAKQEPSEVLDSTSTT